MALLVFFPRAAWTRIVAPNFRSRAHRLWCFRLRRSCLVCHLFFLALLFALHLARKRGKRGSCRFFNSRSRTGRGGKGTWCPWPRRHRLPRTSATLRRSAAWSRRVSFHLHLHVVLIPHRLIIDARHHVFEKDECFLLEFHQGIFLPISAQPDAFFQMIERQQVILPLTIHHIQNDAPL